MHVVVCTVVHHPADARIFYREIQALLDAGHDVTYIAPHESQPPRSDENRSGPGPERVRGSLPTVTIPRAVGRRRLGALRAARRPRWPSTRPARTCCSSTTRSCCSSSRRRRKRPPTVWDVHEDTVAALTTKAWLPGWLRPVAAGGVTCAEHLAERRLHLILAEHGYNDRFAAPTRWSPTPRSSRGRGPAVRPAPRRLRRLALPGPWLAPRWSSWPAAATRTASRWS